MKHTKKLRRLAEAKTVGQPYAAYSRDMTGTVRLHPRCTRAVYKALRRAAK